MTFSRVSRELMCRTRRGPSLGRSSAEHNRARAVRGGLTTRVFRRSTYRMDFECNRIVNRVITFRSFFRFRGNAPVLRSESQSKLVGVERDIFLFCHAYISEIFPFPNVSPENQRKLYKNTYGRDGPPRAWPRICTARRTHVSE